MKAVLWHCIAVGLGCASAFGLQRPSVVRSSAVRGALTMSTTGGGGDSLRFLSPSGAQKCAAAFGTPCYVYDAETLKARASEALAFPNAYGVTVRYAMKACPNAAVLQLFASMGLHFDASSVYESRRAMACGIDPSKISLSTQQLDGDFGELVKLGLEVNCCSLAQ